MSIFIKVKSQTYQDRLFTHHLGQAVNCQAGIEVLSVREKDGGYTTEKNSCFTYDVKNVDDAKRWLAYIKENPYDNIDLDIEQFVIELRLNKYYNIGDTFNQDKKDWIDNNLEEKIDSIQKVTDVEC